jgi:putative ABC transport system substrate-binding protein
MPIDIGRRQAIVVLGGTAFAWPLTARAQQSVPVVGYLHAGTSEANHHLPVALGQGLSEIGYIEGKNVAIEYRWADNQYDRLPALAADLVRRQVAVIATGTPSAAIAAKNATTTIPIVFGVGSDPTKSGLVDSLNRPGHNITGATFFSNLLDAKRLELLHQLVPDAHVIAVLSNLKNPNAEREIHDTQEAARSLGLDLVFGEASTEREIDDAVASLASRHPAALLVTGDAFLNGQGSQIAKLAIQNGLPTSFSFREQAVAGALMSYGASITDTVRQVGNYVGRILKGEKPADLPVQQPTKFELVINMRTARALGLAIPNSMQLLADEVIE